MVKYVRKDSVSNEKLTADRESRFRVALEYWGKQSESAYDSLMAALCEIRLESYKAAQKRCELALRGFLQQPRFWLRGSRPELLIETYLFAGAPGALFPAVKRDIEGYGADYRGSSPWAHYAYILLALLEKQDQQAGIYGRGLIGVRKSKLLAAIGYATQAIETRDSAAFGLALKAVLAVHRGMVKFGELRESPEGFLSLAAMSLSMLALDREIPAAVESEYFSRGYLEYLARPGLPHGS
jgi:hypothetical protein